MKILILSLVSVALFSCGKLNSVLDKAENLPNQLNESNRRLAEVERKTVLGEMIPELEDPANYKELGPIPFELMTPATKVAENFTADEAAKWIYLKLNKIDKAGYEENYGKPNESTNPEAVEFEAHKFGLFNALCAVAGFLPDSTVDQLINKVYSSEEYSATILKILAMRAYFIQNVLLKEKYAPSQLAELGAVESAISYNQSLEKILKLPFAQYVRSKVSGFILTAELNTALSFDLSVIDMKANWKRIEGGMNSYLKVTQFSTNTQTSRVNNARAIVNAGLQAYGVQPTAAP